MGELTLPHQLQPPVDQALLNPGAGASMKASAGFSCESAQPLSELKLLALIKSFQTQLFGTVWTEEISISLGLFWLHLLAYS